MARLCLARALLCFVLVASCGVSASTMDELRRVRHPEFGRRCADILDARPAQRRLVDCVTVYFGTNRRIPAQVRRTTDLADSERSALTLGMADVWLPRIQPNGTPRDRGELDYAEQDLSNQVDRQPFYVYVTRITPNGERSFYTDLTTALRNHRNTTKSILLFVHGFNVDFDEAVIRTAQISIDLRHGDFDPGVPVLFSWPSPGEMSIVAYRGDSRKAERAAPYLRRFLDELLRRPGVEIGQVNIVAHSMGNRVLADALRDYARMSDRRQNVDFRIISAAGDINRVAFTDRANGFASLRPQVTIYASRHDAALMGSEAIAAIIRQDEGNTGGTGLRIGQMNGNRPYVRAGYTSIDASFVADPFKGFGHGYYSDNPSILFDARCALANRPISERELFEERHGEFERHPALLPRPTEPAAPRRLLQSDTNERPGSGCAAALAAGAGVPAIGAYSVF